MNESKKNGRDALTDWLMRHPWTLRYLLIIGTVNLVLNTIEVLVK